MMHPAISLYKGNENERNNCIHHIAFDPTNPNIMIYSGEYFLKKTIDKGRIWNPVLKDDVYFYKTIYDKRNPQILYSTGVTRIPKEEHKFTIHHYEKIHIHPLPVSDRHSPCIFPIGNQGSA